MSRPPRAVPPGFLPLRRRPDGVRYWPGPREALPPGLARRPLLLASVSPRRRTLLQAAGLPLRAGDPGEDLPLPHRQGWAAACLRAVHKAKVGARACPGVLCLGADTIVQHAGKTLGKPRDEAEAKRMLHRLSAAQHEVYTAFCLAWAPGREHGRRDGPRLVWLEVARSGVRFRRLSEVQIEAYVATGAPLDKAGAYGVQDRGHGLVESVTGSYYNVVGLPLLQLRRALRHLGWPGGEPPRGGHSSG